MSKNKTIQEFHQITGLPYSACRRSLKKSHWDINEALFPEYYINFEALSGAIRKAGEAVEKLSETVFDAISSTLNMIGENLSNITAEDLKKYLKENKEDNINE